MDSLCHLWFTTANLSYSFPSFETSATASCGTSDTSGTEFTNITYIVYWLGIAGRTVCADSSKGFPGQHPCVIQDGWVPRHAETNGVLKPDITILGEQDRAIPPMWLGCSFPVAISLWARFVTDGNNICMGILDHCWSKPMILWSLQLIFFVPDTQRPTIWGLQNVENTFVD